MQIIISITPLRILIGFSWVYDVLKRTCIGQYLFKIRIKCILFVRFIKTYVKVFILLLLKKKSRYLRLKNKAQKKMIIIHKKWVRINVLVKNQRFVYIDYTGK